jgi:hypothetical protein
VIGRVGRVARVAGAGVLAVGIVAGLLAGLRLLAVTAPGLVGVPATAVSTPAPAEPRPPVAHPPRPRVPGPWIVADHGAMSCCDTSGQPLDPPVPTVRCLPKAEYRADPPPARPHYWVIPLKGSVPDPADSPDDLPFTPGEPCPAEA